MKFHNIEVDGVKRVIVCAQVFDTNDCFKAMMVIQLNDDDDQEKLDTIISDDFCIYGVNFDLSDMEISVGFEKITIDFDQINGNWALCYVNVE